MCIHYTLYIFVKIIYFPSYLIGSKIMKKLTQCKHYGVNYINKNAFKDITHCQYNNLSI